MFTLSTLGRATNFDTRCAHCQHNWVTQTRTAYHHGDLRTALVVSAVQLVEQHGAAAFSLREAARDIGVSPNAAYRHFEDKSSLMTAAAAAGFADMAKQMQAAMAARSRRRVSPPAVERFKAVGRAYVEFACERPQLFRLMFSEWGADCLGPLATPPAVTPRTLLAQALDDLVAQGLLHEAQREGAELKAWSVVHGFASLAIDGPAAASGTTEHAGELESLLDFTVAGLGVAAVATT